ncbi:MAG: hypothetical protein H7Y89_09810 [Steroidobacteraceae bacterium]|nr:hypothetical protein [Steroidobacteraceae bacterium]
MELSKRNVYIMLAVLAVVVLVIYQPLFAWWDNKSCTESGGTFSSEQNKCIEPRNADIPNTSPAPHDEGGAKPRE